MKEFEGQGGISFILIYYKHNRCLLLLNLRKSFIVLSKESKWRQKEFSFDELDSKYIITCKNSMYIHYLELLNLDICSRT